MASHRPWVSRIKIDFQIAQIDLADVQTEAHAMYKGMKYCQRKQWQKRRDPSKLMKERGSSVNG